LFNSICQANISVLTGRFQTDFWEEYIFLFFFVDTFRASLKTSCKGCVVNMTHATNINWFYMWLSGLA